MNRQGMIEENTRAIELWILNDEVLYHESYLAMRYASWGENDDDAREAAEALRSWAEETGLLTTLLDLGEGEIDPRDVDWEELARTLSE